MSSNSDLTGARGGFSRQPPTHEGLQLLLQTTLDAVVVMTAAGTVADWNDRAVSTFGWTRDEVIGRPMADLIIPERYRDAHHHGLKRYLQTGKAVVLGQRIEVSGLRKNGEEFPLELSISPVASEGSVLFVGCLRDMTDVYALRQARAEVARVTQRMAMDEMAASIVHEINQPLAAISTNAQAGLRWLTRATPDIDEARAALSRVVSDGRRASGVVAGIRMMFKSEGRPTTTHDVNELIREVLTLVHGDVENQRVSVHTEFAQELPQVPANPVQLRQVLVNLVMNAVDAMSSVANRQRVLKLKTQLHQPDCLITVADSGSGIDPQHAQRIFDPFFTTKSHGMGMGLAICRSVVENHGGRLSVARNLPYGTIFQVMLPIGVAASLDAQAT
jgi:PAS domain S-box-containing protein